MVRITSEVSDIAAVEQPAPPPRDAETDFATSLRGTSATAARVRRGKGDADRFTKPSRLIFESVRVPFLAPFFVAHWDGSRATKDKIAAETKATIRCIPTGRPKEPGKCMVTGAPSEGRVVLAKAY
jgi:hypothetical protein